MRHLSKKQQKANRLALADFLDNVVTDKQFAMESWVEPTENDCGTTCCALGWAAYGGVIPGLGWNYHPDDAHLPKNERSVYPVVGGKLKDWESVGEAFFGWSAVGEIFTNHRFTESGDNPLNNRHIVAGALRAVQG